MARLSLISDLDNASLLGCTIFLLNNLYVLSFNLPVFGSIKSSLSKSLPLSIRYAIQ